MLLGSAVLVGCGLIGPDEIEDLDDLDVELVTQPPARIDADEVLPPVRVQVLLDDGSRYDGDGVRIKLAINGVNPAGPEGFSMGVEVSGGVAEFTGLSIEAPGTFYLSPCIAQSLEPAPEELSAFDACYSGIESAEFSVRVPDLSRVSAGGYNSCVVTESGDLFCWGSNFARQLRRDTVVANGESYVLDGTGPYPIPLPDDGIRVVEIGELVFESPQMCGLTSDGRMLCWGVDLEALANDQLSSVDEPVEIATGIARVDIGPLGICDVSVGGDVHCLGSAPAFGTHVPHAHTFAATRTAVPLPVAAAEVAVGDAHACARSEAGAVYCWGSNLRGELGRGTLANPSTAVFEEPDLVVGDHVFEEIGSGRASTCGLTDAGEVLCWGQLDATDPQSVVDGPTVVGSGFSGLSVGPLRACALDSAGAASCWGSNGDGFLGVGSGARFVAAPTPVVGGHAFESIAVGLWHTCGLATDGVYCWGDNVLGQLGLGLFTVAPQFTTEPTLVLPR